MLAFRQHVDVIVRSIVLWCTVGALCVATQLAHWLHAGGTTVDELHEVVVTVSGDGDTHLDAVADLQFTLRQKLTGDGETRSGSLNRLCGLHELGIDSAP